MEMKVSIAVMQEKVGEASEFLKKLSNPNRLMIACALVEGERSVGELEELLDIRQPGLSQQIAELRDAGLIAGRREGKAVFYSLSDGRVSEFIGLMHRLFCSPEAGRSVRKSRGIPEPGLSPSAVDIISKESGNG